MLLCLIELLMKKKIFSILLLPVQSKIFCQSSPGYRKNRVILYFILENHDLSYESWYALSRRHVRARFVIDFLDVIASSWSTPLGESSILRLVYRCTIDGYKNPVPIGWVLLAIAWAAYVARRATFVDAFAFGHFAEQNSMDVSYFDISYRNGCLLFLRCSLFGHLCGVKRFGKINADAIYCCL